MIIVDLKKLREVAAIRPPGYLEDVFRKCKTEGDKVHCPDNDYYALRSKYTPDAQHPKPERVKSTPAKLSPVPLNQWPIWAKGLRAMSTASDRGIGDVVARLIGPETSEAFKVFYRKLTGKDCGCPGRQAEWNILYPLNHDEQSPQPQGDH